jgi:sugar phosphate isomerase/epimerase
MQIGASTSCFYPLETEKALAKVIDLGFKKAEVFFNTFSELEDPFVMDMKRTADDAGMEILSVHPFSSHMENICIFGEYQRRYDDFIALYQKHFHAAALLGAKYVVIHGAYEKQKRPLPAEHYFERFASLIEVGKREGVTVCQENVVAFRSQSIDFLKQMRNYLGDDFHMVFDVKQAIRSGYNPFEVVDEFKNDIAHIHLSDNKQGEDCIPPGRGTFDFKRLFDTMNGAGYKGSYVIELYSLGYDIEKELALSKEYLERF